jgi:hypothetical protein
MIHRPGNYQVGEQMTAKDRLNQPFPYKNNDRFAMVSVLANHDEGFCAIKIHGLAPTQDAAEEIAKQASRDGYQNEVFIADTFAWLPLPPNKVEKQVHMGEQLEKIVGKKIESENVQFVAMKKRQAKATKATTAYERFLLLVEDAAVKLIESKDDHDKPDLESMFASYRKKELELVEMENKDGKHMHEARRFLREQKREGNFTPMDEKTKAKAIKDVESAGMGLPHM